MTYCFPLDSSLYFRTGNRFSTPQARVVTRKIAIFLFNKLLQHVKFGTVEMKLINQIHSMVCAKDTICLIKTQSRYEDL